METTHKIFLNDIAAGAAGEFDLIALPRIGEWISLTEADTAVIWKVVTVVHSPEADAFDIYAQRLGDRDEALTLLARAASGG
ncbi:MULTISPECIES: hypothetical protein [Burkholderia cepacia complex]|uniref:hypothetical protein n=1 Tax=Burkholderia cepacia complex TaxID=87882 RepID=UPI000B27671D|nr:MULTISPECIES: hypothetical protein [Burkholderia cepacia complex]MDY7807578.1 hypothetical protein [Burkholderia stagnalis]